MKGFCAFFKKELTEQLRTGKLFIIIGIFILLAVLNPILTKLTPVIMDLLSAELAAAGLDMGNIPATVLESWGQFFKNLLIGFIVFICLMAGCFTREYNSGSLILMLTRGLKRRNIIFAKAGAMLLLWSAAYWLYFGVTYGINQIFWDNGDAANLFISVVYPWVFGVLTVCIITFASVVFKGMAGVMLGTGGILLVFYVFSMLPVIGEYSPFMLTAGVELVYSIAAPGDFTAPLLITLGLSAALFTASLLMFNKKKL